MRFASERPNSIWRPSGRSSHLSGRSCRLSTSCRSLRDQTATWLIQVPRLVDRATSAEAVTIRWLLCGEARSSSARTRPNASCVDERRGLGGWMSLNWSAGSGRASGRLRRSVASAR